MLFGSPLGAAFTCSGSVCYGSPNFAVFQNEINRLSARVGLPANLAVDGQIGTGTIAKFAVLAKRLKSLLGPYFAEELDDYTSTDIIVGMSAKVLANQVPLLISVLHNGVTMRCSLEGVSCNLPAWAKAPSGAAPPPSPVPVLPIVNWIRPATPTKPPPQVAVGPTAPPGSNALPPFPGTRPKGVVVVAAVLGTLAVAGLVLGLARRHAHA